jgi:hypothetical protein
MQMPMFIKKYYWWLPCCLYSADSYAWGLVTHLYFAQSLLWAMPLLDPRLQNAIKKFPDLVMAGACLPDLALFSQRFRHSHLWENAHHLLQVAQNDEQLALAVGYASHLYIDVIAHNHFVPAHEAMWLNRTISTHIASEWAMDAYLAPLLNTTPTMLLRKHQQQIAAFISPHFRCEERRTIVALKRLAWGDGLLRSIKLPNLIYRTVSALDRRTRRHFIYYVAKTQLAMADVGVVLNGTRPQFDAELKNISIETLEVWRSKCLAHLKQLHPTPIDYFSSPSERA